MQRHAARHARRARSCIVVHFTCPLVALRFETCPLVALRFEGTFHVFDNELAKTFHFCAVGIFHVFVYYYNYAGQTSIRVRRRVMDLRAGLDGGGVGNTLAVLSSPRRPKMCVKPRSTACPHSVCPAEKIHVLHKGAHFRLSLIAPLRRTFLDFFPHCI